MDPSSRMFYPAGYDPGFPPVVAVSDPHMIDGAMVMEVQLAE